LTPGEVYPFPNKIHHCMFTIWKLEDGESHLERFERDRKPIKSVIKEYRELSLEVELSKGRWMIVPSCKKPG
jgi:hypothetical protein